MGQTGEGGQAVGGINGLLVVLAASRVYKRGAQL
jgi:hypothetical protein